MSGLWAMLRGLWMLMQAGGNIEARLAELEAEVARRLFAEACRLEGLDPSDYLVRPRLSACGAFDIDVQLRPELARAQWEEARSALLPLLRLYGSALFARRAAIPAQRRSPPDARLSSPGLRLGFRRGRSPALRAPAMPRLSPAPP